MDVKIYIYIFFVVMYLKNVNLKRCLVLFFIIRIKIRAKKKTNDKILGAAVVTFWMFFHCFFVLRCYYIVCSYSIK
jgi:hypothetical protein